MNMGESNRRRIFLAKVFNCISDLTENSVLAREEMSLPCSERELTKPVWNLPGVSPKADNLEHVLCENETITSPVLFV